MRSLADDLGVTSTAVRLWETGDRNVSAEHLERYVSILEELRDCAGGTA
jgi:transcriptional regulator with XRE-family HTH domain